MGDPRGIVGNEHQAREQGARDDRKAGDEPPPDAVYAGGVDTLEAETQRGADRQTDRPVGHERDSRRPAAANAPPWPERPVPGRRR